MDHDAYDLFRHFWWLIFPMFWMFSAMGGLWSRHSRANRALDIIKSYADQGKEPPVELMKALQVDRRGRDWGGRCGNRSPEERLGRAFLFAALACAFGFMAFWPRLSDDPRPHNVFGLVLVTAILAACAVSNLLSVVFRSRDLPPPDDRNGRTP